MSVLPTIEPADPLRHMDVIRFIAGGSGRDMASAMRAESLLQAARNRGLEDAHLWWARRQRQVVAAAMVLSNPGRAGMIFYSAPAAPGVERRCLPQVIQACSREALARGLWFVQALMEPQAKDEAQVVVNAGFEFLAELVYMAWDLREAAADPVTTALEAQYDWRDLTQVSQAELSSVILETYKQSLDCPRLAGLRPMEDVLASHRACGMYRPQTWWVLYQQQRPAGCVLVSDYPHNDTADVVYLAVAPEFRGMSLARVMLGRAGRHAATRGMSTMTLAVDVNNIYARRAYNAQGFVDMASRHAYIFTGKTLQLPPQPTL